MKIWKKYISCTWVAIEPISTKFWKIVPLNQSGQIRVYLRVVCVPENGTICPFPLKPQHNMYYQIAQTAPASNSATPDKDISVTFYGLRKT